MQPFEPENNHAPSREKVEVANPRGSAEYSQEPKQLEEIPMIPVGSPMTSAQISSLKGGHDRPLSVVPNGDVEKGFLGTSVSVQNLSQHVRTPTIAVEDEGRGYEDWLKMEKLEPKDFVSVIAKHKAKQLAFVILLVVPSIVLCYLFALLVEDAVRQWNAVSISPLQQNPIIAGLIGEPFHKLESPLLYGTFAALVILCPFLCCQTKMLGHLLFMYGRQMMPVWKTAMTMGCLMAGGNMLAALVMHTTGVHVPRIVWMGVMPSESPIATVIFGCLFGGLFLCARQASRILGFPEFTFLYFRASFIANVMLYLYAVFFPFWFFGTTSLPAKLVLAIGFHPCVEFMVGFLFQHTATKLRYNDPCTSINPGFHYATLFALYGAFLLVNFDEAWQNILGFTLLRGWTILCKVFAQELTYGTYVCILRKTPADTAAILSTVRFKRYRNDVINTGFLVESLSIVVAGAVTFLFRFNKSKEAAEPATTGLGETFALVGGQVVIGALCDAIADAGLAYRGLPWHNAWKTQQEWVVPKFSHIVVVSVGMFLFYFYPFLASHMVIDGSIASPVTRRVTLHMRRR